MIDPKAMQAIRKEVRRFSGLSFPPQEMEGWEELAKVLQRRCASMDQVHRVIDRWLDTEENVPKPSQLGFLCADVAAGDDPVLPAPCDRCEPDGLWISMERLNSAGEIVSCMGRCECPRGRQLATRDAKRAIEAARKQPTVLKRIVDPPREEIS